MSKPKATPFMPRKTHSPTLQPDPLAPAMVGFRLGDEESRRLLGQRAARLGVSPHDLARYYVLEMLQERQERAVLREALGELHEQFQQFRADFAFAVQGLLTSAGKVSENQARAWVNASIKPE
jgi:hypothetical protein